MNLAADVSLPWLEAARQQLERALSLDRVAPALLIRGPSGIGKTVLARQYARRLLCRTPQDQGACGSCRACLMLAAGTHPDYLEIRPEEPLKPIKVEAIRALTAQMSLTSHFGGYRVAVIDQADALNQHAVNALLKTLEEPPEGTVLILVSGFPERLPATLRSRCSPLGVARPSRAMACQWLKSQGIGEDALLRLDATSGSPLAALELDAKAVLEKRSACFSDFLAVFEGHKDPIDMAEAWAGHVGERELFWWMDWVAGMIRLALAPDLGDNDQNADLQEGLRRMQQRTSVHFLLESHARVLRCLESLRGPTNRQLALETLLLHWALGRTEGRLIPAPEPI